MTQREHLMKDPSTRPEAGYPPFNGTLIVRLQIKDATVDRVLIDNRSEVNILLRGQLEEWTSQMKSTQESPLSKPLMELHSTSWGQSISIHLMTFHVMDNRSPYNVTFGREWLHVMENVIFKDRIPPHYSKVTSSSKRFNDRETR